MGKDSSDSVAGLLTTGSGSSTSPAVSCSTESSSAEGAGVSVSVTVLLRPNNFLKKPMDTSQYNVRSKFK